MTETNQAIEAGATIELRYGFGQSEQGILVAKETSKWGTDYKIQMSDGREEWTNEIREEGQTSANGSPVGSYIVR